MSIIQNLINNFKLGYSKFNKTTNMANIEQLVETAAQKYFKELKTYMLAAIEDAKALPTEIKTDYNRGVNAVEDGYTNIKNFVEDVKTVANVSSSIQSQVAALQTIVTQHTNAKTSNSTALAKLETEHQANVAKITAQNVIHDSEIINANTLISKLASVVPTTA